MGKVVNFFERLKFANLSLFGIELVILKDFICERF